MTINRLVITGLVVAGVVAAAAPVGAQTKEARGSITAITDTTLTVKSGAQDIIFYVDGQTHLTVSSAAKKIQQAQPGSRPRVNDFFETGMPVLVRYREEGGRNHALDIERVGSAGPGADATKIADGKVKSVTASQLTIEGGGKDWAFTINGETNVLARGASTATKTVGGNTQITSFVHVGDTVSVSYREVGGGRTASEVRVRVVNPDQAKPK